MIARVLLLALAGLVALGACSRPSPRKPRPSHREADGRVRLPEAAAKHVKVETVAESEALAPWPLPARVASDDRLTARVGTPVSGVVAEVMVVTGDAVERGQPLATLRSPDVSAARADVEQARLRVTMARKTLDRATRLVGEGAGTEAERLDAEEALGRAEQQLSRAQAAFAALGGAKAGGPAGFVVRAPIAGTVIARNASVGAEARPDDAEPLIVIAALERVWVLADVPPPDLGAVVPGAMVEIKVDGLPGRRFSAAIDHVSEVVDPVTTMARARIVLDNTDGALRPGMFARVRVLQGGARQIAIPMSAVLTRRDETFVFTQDPDGAFRQRKVTLGRQAGQHVAVLDGLAAGEAVVVDGAILLDVEANEAL